jgi:hypothetical protein
VFGARPLKRAIQQRIENPVAKLILEGRFGPKDVIPVDVDGGEFVFSRVVHCQRPALSTVSYAVSPSSSCRSRRCNCSRTRVRLAWPRSSTACRAMPARPGTARSNW